MVDLHVIDTGYPGGPVVVWLGSLGTTTAMWERQIAVLGHRARCVLIDHPGHGSSPARPGPYTVRQLADGVVSTLDRLDIERAHVVGLAFGSVMAMSLGVHRADRIDRLALLSTSAHLGPAEGLSERAAVVRADGPQAVASMIVGHWLTPAYAESHPDEVAAFVAMISAVDREGYAAGCEAVAAVDLRDVLPHITAETLVVVGDADRATPPEHAEQVASLIPNGRLEVVNGAHLANWESADDVNALLAEHLLWDEQP